MDGSQFSLVNMSDRCQGSLNLSGAGGRTNTLAQPSMPGSSLPGLNSSLNSTLSNLNSLPQGNRTRIIPLPLSRIAGYVLP